jgi:hypothetical protein
MLEAGCYIPCMSNLASNRVPNLYASFTMEQLKAARCATHATLTDEKLTKMSEECYYDLFNLDYCSSGGGRFRDQANIRANWTAGGSAACRAIHARWRLVLVELAIREKEREEALATFTNALNDKWEELQMNGRQGLGRGA